MQSHNQDAYTEELEPILQNLCAKDQLRFAIDTASGTLVYWTSYFADDILLEHSLNVASSFLITAVPSTTIDSLIARVGEGERIASREYEENFPRMDLNTAGPIGIRIFQAKMASASIAHMLMAIQEFTDEQDVSLTCAFTGSLAWAASFFDESERACQLKRLDSMRG